MKFFYVSLFVVGLHSGFSQSTEGMSLVFSDDFTNNRNGWFTSMSGDNISRVNNDRQFLEVNVNKKGTSERSWVQTRIDFNQNFVLKASVRVVSSFDGKNDVKCGFLFGLSDIKYAQEQSWYRFLLYSNKKKVQVYAANNGQDFFLSENLDLPVYDSSDYNEMAVMRNDEEVSFFLNGNKIYSNRVINTTSGSIIFEASNLQNAYVKRIEVYQ